jgi:membrane glycosyltransferase
MTLHKESTTFSSFKFMLDNLILLIFRPFSKMELIISLATYLFIEVWMLFMIISLMLPIKLSRTLTDAGPSFAFVKTNLLRRVF